MVIHAVHEIVSTSIFVEVFGVGERVSPHESPFELGVGSYKVSLPTCSRSEVILWVRILTQNCEVGGSTVFAKQFCPFVVGQTVHSIHVEIVLAECEDEFPHGAVVVFGDWGPVPVTTFDHILDLFPELLPWRSTYYSWFSLLANVAVVYKPRLDVTAVDEQWAPLKDINCPLFPVRGRILVDHGRYRSS